MSKEVKRYDLKIVNRYAGDGTGEIETIADIVPGDFGRYVRLSDYDALLAEIERLQMQLVACGVVALANTPESAAEARVMHPDYMSASCQDVMRAVDREMALLAERDRLLEDKAELKRRLTNEQQKTFVAEVQMVEIGDQRDQFRTEVEALQKDAERYQLLASTLLANCNGAQMTTQEGALYRALNEIERVNSTAEIDAIFDAALQGEQP